MNLKPLKFSIVLAATLSLSFFGCGPGEDGNGPGDGTPIDSPTVMTISVDGKIFSIPSPIQTAMLIKRSGANYNKAYLNPADKVNGYSMQMQKALNLGVFGADLGYVTMYDQNQDAIAFFQAAQKLAEDLGVSGAFDKALIQRFKANIGKQDSMLNLVATESWKTKILSSLKIELNVPSIAINALAGASTSMLFGVSPQLGAALGAFSSMLRFEVTLSNDNIFLQERIRDFSYVFHAAKELNLRNV